MSFHLERKTFTPNKCFQTDHIVEILPKLAKCHLIPGDWERKDSGFCHSYHRTSPEERRKAKEDAGTFILLLTDCSLIDHLLWAGVDWGSDTLLSCRCCWCAGGGLGHHSHKRTGPSDQRGDGAVHPEIPTVHVSTKSLKRMFTSRRCLSKISMFALMSILITDNKAPT